MSRLSLTLAASIVSASFVALVVAPSSALAAKIPLDIKDAKGAAVSGDPVSGKAVFTQCMTCHSAKAGENKVGPSLHGIIGRHSGIVPGFHYSTANKNSGLVWTASRIRKSAPT
jgi:cytochrome c